MVVALSFSFNEETGGGGWLQETPAAGERRTSEAVCACRPRFTSRRILLVVLCPTWAQRREDRPFAAGEVCRAALRMSSQPSVAAGSCGVANCVSSALSLRRRDLVLGC